MSISRAKTLEVRSTASQQQGNYTWPVGGKGGRVSSHFSHARKSPISGRVKPHKGLDIAAAKGTAVQAAKSGRVTFAGDRHDGYGNQIVIDHGNGEQTRYAHLSQIDSGIQEALNRGETPQVAQGQRIAGVGSTGSSTGNHLHFEMIKNGKAVNPYPVLAQNAPLNDSQGIAVASLPKGGTSNGGRRGARLQSAVSDWLPSINQMLSNPNYQQVHSGRRKSGKPSNPFRSSASSASSRSQRGAMPSGDMMTMIKQVAAKYGIPLDIMMNLVKAESNFDPNAESSAGAVGLMQLMPGTARDQGLKVDLAAGIDERKIPSVALDAGASYLRQQYDKFGSWKLALAAYNAGPGNVAKAGNQIPNFKETQNYVAKVTRGTPYA